MILVSQVLGSLNDLRNMILESKVLDILNGLRKHEISNSDIRYLDWSKGS
jgi:hypothetical protein